MLSLQNNKQPRTGKFDDLFTIKMESKRILRINYLEPRFELRTNVYGRNCIWTNDAQRLKDRLNVTIYLYECVTSFLSFLRQINRIR